MAGYKTFTVNIVLQDGGDLMKRIQTSADNRGISFQDALQEAVDIGCWGHIERNLEMVDRAYSTIKQ